MPIICSFFGHRNISENIKSVLYTEIENHIKKNKVDVFYVGGYGQFDRMASGILHELKDRYPHISVYHVLAYIPTGAKKESFEKEQPTLYPNGLETVPRKFAITYRNRIMIDQSDYVVGYVRMCYGGAYEALKYAERKNKNIVNLATG